MDAHHLSGHFSPVLQGNKLKQGKKGVIKAAKVVFFILVLPVKNRTQNSVDICDEVAREGLVMTLDRFSIAAMNVLELTQNQAEKKHDGANSW